jgi:hypothetical protein
MGMYGEADLKEMFGLLRTIRVAAGDFAEESPAGTADTGNTGDQRPIARSASTMPLP